MFFSSSKNSEYWAGTMLMSVAGFGEGAARKRIEEWLGCGLLTKDTYKHPRHGKKTEKLLVNPAMRAALIHRLSGEQ